MDSDFNQGIYSDKKMALEWDAWVQLFKDDETRAREIYPFLLKWIAENKPGRILEVGSGQGICSKELNLSKGYVGIEPSKHLREIAHGLYPEKDFRPGLAENIPLPDSSMDGIFSVFVLLHVAQLDLAAKEMSRVLRPSGRFCIVAPNPAMNDLWISWHKDPLIKGKEVSGCMKHLSGHVMYLHSLEEIKYSLVDAGLDILDTKYCGSKNGDPGFVMILSGIKK